MSVTITSFVPTFAGGTVTFGTLIINAPNQGVNGQLALLFTAPDEIIIGTGAQAFSVENLGDVLDGTFGPGYTYNELLPPIAPLNANFQAIINLQDPVALQEAATKNYVDTQLGLIGGPFLPLSGGTMSGDLVLDGNRLVLGSATNDEYIVNSAPGEVIINILPGQRLLKGTTSEIDVGSPSKPIINLLDPINPQDAATKNYVDTVVGGSGPFLPLSGGTMTGNIHLDETNRIELDTDLDTFLTAPSDDKVELWIGGAKHIDVEITQLDLVSIKPILNVQDPTNPQDAATKNYVDTEIISLGLTGVGPYLPLAGGTMTGNLHLDETNRLELDTDLDSFLVSPSDDKVELWLGGSKHIDVEINQLDLVSIKPILNVQDPTNPQDAATKNYVDTEIVNLNLGGTGPFLQLAGGIMTGPLTLSGAPVSPLQAATKDYIDTEIVSLGLTGTGPYLKLDGTTPLTGNMDAGGNKLSSVMDPASAQDAATKNYVDTEIVSLGLTGTGPFLRLSGADTMAGDLDMGNNSITNLLPPIVGTDGANKDYVDTEIVSLNLNGTGPYLRLSGADAMAGDIDLGGNSLINVGTATFGDHVLGVSDYTSNLGGDSHKIRLSATPSAATPTYSFVSDDDTGMYRSSANTLTFVTNAAPRLSLGTSAIDAHSHRIVNVSNPTNDNDAANKQYVDGINGVRQLGKVTGVDLTTTGVTLVYTVPVSKVHIITGVVIRLTSFVPGGSPGSVVINVGISGAYDQVVQGYSINFSATNAGDQAWYMFPLPSSAASSEGLRNNGAYTPNAGDDVRFNVVSATPGTISSAVAEVHVLGFEA